MVLIPVPRCFLEMLEDPIGPPSMKTMTRGLFSIKVEPFNGATWLGHEKQNMSHVTAVPLTEDLLALFI